jgi:hypothetical protein
MATLSLTNTQIADYLDQAYNLIENPKNWTQKVSARDLYGNTRHAKDDDATCWCLKGAIYKVAEDKSLGTTIIKFLSKITKIEALEKFNDNHTHPEVLELLKSVSAKLREEV